jgi:lipoprotein-releasing system ATP-binding protein
MNDVPGNRECLLEAIDLGKAYHPSAGPLEVLSNVGFKIVTGDVVGIIGASGVGKSTLLHILGGLDRPSTGKVLFRGRDIYSAGNGFLETFRNRHIGFVFQSFNLLSDFTALENVMFPALIGGMKKDEARQRAEQLLSRMGLARRIQHRPPELSGGESQRVALARALVNRPEILFADEPTGNLDSHAADSLIELIGELNREFLQTFVIVTHSQRIARRMNDVYALLDGKIQPVSGREIVI